MNRRPLEPLSPEERALADQLARLGPHGEPSAALDARILAAAHDAIAVSAAARPRSRRWPVGLGVAATTLLAVGIAWQLRPTDTAQLYAPPVAERAAEPALTADTDAVEAADIAPAPRSIAQAPAQEPPAMQESLPPAVAPSASRAPASPPRQVQSKRVPSPAVASENGPSGHSWTAAVPPPPPPAPPAPAGSYAVDAAPAAVAAPADAASAPLNPGRDELGSVADAATTAAIARQREQARAEQTRTLDSAKAQASRSEAQARASRASAELQEAVPSKPRMANAPSAPSAGLGSPSGPVRNALKRTDLQLPVSEDSKLDPDDWLERIRLRRDLGDHASASESLLRFKQSHPFQKVPDDLQELLGP